MAVLEFILSLLGGFATQITIGALLFCSPMKRRSHFKWRLLPLAPFCLLPTVFSFATGQSFYLLPAFFIGWFAYIFLAMLFVLSLLIWFCFDGPYLKILYYCSASHILQNLAYMIRSLIEQSGRLAQGSVVYSLVPFLSDLMVWALAYWFLVRRINREPTAPENQTLILFSVSATLVVNVLHYWTYAFGYLNPATLIYDAVCCVLLLAIQFGIFDLSKYKLEHQIMAHLHGTMERQQSLAKENIEIINRKCHDLKHQIALFRRMSADGEEQRRLLGEIENAVGIYDTIVRTGNDVLDTILTEKSLLCEQRKINMTIIADGRLLSFMEAADLYSLFGNALDNAIESVCREKEENRIISLHIAQRSGILTVLLDNYCSTPLHFENGIPVTTKEQNGYHGFGVPSIRYIVKKYGGTFSFRQDFPTRRVSLALAFPNHPEPQVSPHDPPNS